MIQYIKEKGWSHGPFDVNKVAGAIYKGFSSNRAKYDLVVQLYR